MEIPLTRCSLRSLTDEDAAVISPHANNRKVWRNLRDAFPHPYGLADAKRFIERVSTSDPEGAYAIEVDGQTAGCIGLKLGEDVERFSAEVGYWLAEHLWGKGIMTDALPGFTSWAMDTHDLNRVHAAPFAWNIASCRVLEKAGFQFEGRLRKNAFKDGEVVDQLLYAFIRQD
jgi:ribosomal-protein-alanine N-acetyltransferase